MVEIIRSKIGVLTYLAPSGTISNEEGLAALEETVAACIRDREVNIIIDLDRVPNMTGAVLELFLDIQDKLARVNGALKIINPSALIQDVFMITGIGDYIAVINEPQEESV